MVSMPSSTIRLQNILRARLSLFTNKNCIKVIQRDGFRVWGNCGQKYYGEGDRSWYVDMTGDRVDNSPYGLDWRQISTSPLSRKIEEQTW